MLAELVGRGVSGPWENIGRLVQTREDLAVMAEVILGDQLRDPGDRGVASCGHMSFKMTTSPHPAEPAAPAHPGWQSGEAQGEYDGSSSPESPRLVGLEHPVMGPLTLLMCTVRSTAGTQRRQDGVCLGRGPGFLKTLGSA